jgi:hypothetical protein
VVLFLSFAGKQGMTAELQFQLVAYQPGQTAVPFQ